MSKGLITVKSEKKSASCHMQKDEIFLKNLKDNPKLLLHFYEWEKPSLTFGYFIKPDNHLHLDTLKKKNLDIAKRPTGGGITFHLFDLAFSLLLPSHHPCFSLNALNNYAFINDIVLKAALKFSGLKGEPSLLVNATKEKTSASYFCMAQPTKYDVFLNGKKVGGAAERLTKFGLLHQGTLTLKLPADDFLRSVLKDKDVFSCMKRNSCLLLDEQANEKTVLEAKNELQQLLIEAFSSNLL